MELSRYFEELVRFLQKILTKPIYITIGGKKLKKKDIIPPREKIVGIIIAVLLGTFLFFLFLFGFQSIKDKFDFKEVVSLLEFFSFVMFVGLFGATIFHYKKRLFDYKILLNVLVSLLLQLLFIVGFNFVLGILFYLFIHIFPEIFLINFYFILFLFLNFFFAYFVTDKGFELVSGFSQLKNVLKAIPEYIVTAFIIDMPIMFFVLTYYIVNKYKISQNFAIFLYVFDFSVLFFYIFFYWKDSVMITSDYENFNALKKAVILSILLSVLLFILGIMSGIVSLK